MSDKHSSDTDRSIEGGSGYCEHGSSGPCPECDGAEQCDRCEDLHNNCQDGLDGEKVCPQCIRKESNRHQAEQMEQKRRRNVRKERGWWREQ